MSWATNVDMQYDEKDDHYDKITCGTNLAVFNIVQKGGAQMQISSLKVVKFLSATNRAKSTATPGYSSREARSDGVKQKFDNGIVALANRVCQNCVSPMEIDYYR